nr:hypothetical protein GTC16762_31950 [Pigmentibacter ruber]
MKVDIKDSETFSQITPNNISSYLSSNGWRPAKSIPGKANIWEKEVDNETYEVLCPLKTEFGDYAFRIRDLVSVLEKQEKRSQIEIISALKKSEVDVIRVRITENSATEGVPATQGVDAIKSIYELTNASACSALEPRAAYLGKKPDQVANYISKLKLGHTERGSFIFTLLSPVNPSFSKNRDEISLEDEPFERKVTLKLCEALEATHKALTISETSQDFDVFSSRIEHGVNANICQALSNLTKLSEKVELSITWANSRPSNKPIYRQHFYGRWSGILEEAAKRFTNQEPRPDEKIFGLIVKLQRDANQSEGKVTVKTQIDGKLSSIIIRAADDDDSKFVVAHDKKVPIVCQGTLIKKGKQWELNLPTNIQEVNED